MPTNNEIIKLFKKALPKHCNNEICEGKVDNILTEMLDEARSDAIKNYPLMKKQEEEAIRADERAKIDLLANLANCISVNAIYAEIARQISKQLEQARSDTAKEIFKELDKEIKEMEKDVILEPCCKANIKDEDTYCQWHYFVLEFLPALKKQFKVD